MFFFGNAYIHPMTLFPDLLPMEILYYAFHKYYFPTGTGIDGTDIQVPQTKRKEQLSPQCGTGNDRNY